MGKEKRRNRVFIEGNRGPICHGPHHRPQQLPRQGYGEEYGMAPFRVVY